MGIPPTYTIDFTAGDALKFVFQVMDKDLDLPEEPPIPRDLTDWEVLSQVRQTPTSAEVLATWTIVGTLDASGIINMKIPGTVTQSWAALTTVVSDVQLTDPAGDPETVLKLIINAAQDITRE